MIAEACKFCISYASRGKPALTSWNQAHRRATRLHIPRQKYNLVATGSLLWYNRTIILMAHAQQCRGLLG